MSNVVVVVAVLFATACTTQDRGMLHGEPADRRGPRTAGGVITGVTFDWSTHRREAPGSDNWPATWSDDDHQYAVWGDGGGFGGTNTSGRVSFGVARIEGAHTAYRGVNRYGGRNRECPSSITGKGHGAPISINGVLYVWITPGSNTAGYTQFLLYKSTNKGCSWRNVGVEFVRSTHGISYGTFVQFGKDNADARDEYAYSIAAEVTNATSVHIVQKPGRIVLLRVPVADIEKQAAYEFYAGRDGAGQPTWSSRHADRRPIYEDADGIGPWPQMSYVPGVTRYVYSNQHGDGVGTTAIKSLLTMGEAPEPWGPWNVFYRDVFFTQIEQTVFQWSFAPKWFRNGGRDFTIIFSGINSNDSWNTVNGTFHLAP